MPGLIRERGTADPGVRATFDQSRLTFVVDAAVASLTDGANPTTKIVDSVRNIRILLRMYCSGLNGLFKTELLTIRKTGCRILPRARTIWCRERTGSIKFPNRTRLIGTVSGIVRLSRRRTVQLTFSDFFQQFSNLVLDLVVGPFACMFPADLALRIDQSLPRPVLVSIEFPSHILTV